MARGFWLLLIAALGAAGCSPGGKPPAAAAAPAAEAPATEGPRIVMSDDLVHLEYRVFGRGEPAVFLIHGWCGNADYWHAQIEALEGRYTVVALDLAGHGASGANRTDWSIANYAADVATVARQIPNTRIVLVGHSMGATVALAAVPRLNGRVIGVIAGFRNASAYGRWWEARTVWGSIVNNSRSFAREVLSMVAPVASSFWNTTRGRDTESSNPRGAWSRSGSRAAIRRGPTLPWRPCRRTR